MYPLTKNQRLLIYILITILFSYIILNFIIINPICIKEFPPKLPVTVFLSLYVVSNLLFIILSFEPIFTRKKCYTLIILLLLNLTIPLSYKLKYHPIIINLVITVAAMISLKECLFIKYNRKYLSYTKINQQKEFTPFILTLFNWRHDSCIIPPSKSKTDERKPTITQIDKKIKSRILILIWKWMLHEIFIYLFVAFSQKIPEKSYQFRLIEYFIKRTPAFTVVSMFRCICFAGFIFLSLSFDYDITLIISLISLRYITTISPTIIEKHFLIKSGLLTSLQFFSIKDYLITFTFNTKHCFDNPWISTSPREFWSIRWQNVFAEGFKELGYLPIRNLCINIGITSKKICNAMGVLGAFFISSILHEYLITGLFNALTGEHLFFFMFHGLLLIIWEGVFGVEKENVMKESYDHRKKGIVFLKWLLLLCINILVLPAFIEPMIRRMDLWVIPSVFTDIHNIS